MKAYRVDVGGMGAVKKTEDGFAMMEVRATRVGVFAYQRADGSVQMEYKAPAEVFNWESMRTLAKKPVTNEHPPTLLTTLTATKFSRGFTGDYVRSDEFEDGNESTPVHVIVDATVTDQPTIDDIESGRKLQVSCGYTTIIDPTPGATPEGIAYDAIQRSIRYNHLAIVEKGRLGTTRLKLDAADGEAKMDVAYQVGGDDIIDQPTITSKKEKVIMGSIKHDGVEIEVSDTAVPQVKAWLDKGTGDLKSANERADKAEANLTDAKKETVDTQAKLDAATDEVTTLQKQAKDQPDISVAVIEMVKTLDTARKVMPKDEVDKFDPAADSFDAKNTIAELKRAIVAAHSPDTSLDGKDAVYFDHRVDFIRESIGDGKSKTDDQKKALGDAAKSGGKPTKDAAQQAMVDKEVNRSIKGSY